MAAAAAWVYGGSVGIPYALVLALAHNWVYVDQSLWGQLMIVAIASLTSWFVHRREPIAPLPLTNDDNATSSFFENVPIGLFRTDANGIVLNVNQMMLQISGYQLEDVIGYPLTKFYRNKIQILRMQRRLAQSGVIIGIEMELLHANGTSRHVKINVEEVRDDDAQVVFYNGSLEDITDLKRIEAALAQSESLNQTIIQSVHEGVVVYDQDLKYQVWNSFMEKLTGLKAEQVLNKAATEVFPYLIEQGVEELLHRALQGQIIHSSQSPYYMPQTKQTGWTESVYGPLVDEDGKIIGVITTIYDITERKRSANERERLLSLEQKRAKELTLLAETGAVISSNLDIDQILQIVADQMVELFNVNACAISEWNPTENTIRLWVEQSNVESKIQEKWFTPIDVDTWPNTSAVLKDGVVIQMKINDIDLMPASKDYLAETKIQSLLMLPLMTQNGVVGLIELEDMSNSRIFSEEDINLAQMLANQAAVAIENARLFNATQRQLDELAALHALSTFGADTNDEDQFIEYATKYISQVFYTENFGILLLDDSGKKLLHHPTYISTSEIAEPTILIGEGVTGRVARTGQPSLVGLVTDDPEYLIYDDSMRSEIAVPLKIGERVLGVLDAESARPYAFTNDDLRLMSTLAGQIAVTIERLRRQKAEARQARQLTTLNELTREMTGTLNTTELCNIVTTRLFSEFGYISGVMLLDQAENKLTLHGQAGMAKGKTEKFKYNLSTESGLVGKAFKEKTYVLASNVQENPDYISVGNETVLSELVLPLRVEKDAIIGVLILDSETPHAFSDSDISAFSTLADQLAIALDKATLFEREKLQRQQAETLRQVAASLSRDLGKDTVLSTVLAELKNIVAYNSASVMLIEGDSLVIQAVAGAHIPAETVGFRFLIEENIISQPMVKHSETVLHSDVRDLPYWLEAPGADQIISWIGAPLMIRGECIGLLTVDGYNLGQFNQEDAKMVETFAQHAAAAIENARLVDETTQTLNRELQLNEIAQRLSEGLDLDELLQDIVRMACEAVGAESGSIGMLTKDKQQLEFRYAYNPRMPGRSTTAKGQGLAWDILESPQGKLINDYARHPKSLSESETQAIHTFAGVPITAGEEVIGVLGVYNHDPEKHLTERDLALVLSIGQQAGLAIENARLFQETSEALIREKNLNQLSRAISSTLDIEEILHNVVTIAAETLNVAYASIALVNPELDEATNVYYSIPNEYIEPAKNVKIGQAVATREVLSTSKSVVTNDYQNSTYKIPFWEKRDVTAMIVSPIQIGDINIGVLGALCVNPNKAFTERDIETLESVARQAAIAIQNAQLFQEVQQRNRRLEALYEIALSTNAILDLNILLDQLRSKVAFLIQPQSYRLALMDANQPAFNLVDVYAIGVRREVDSSKTYSIETGGLLGYILKTREPLVVNDVKVAKLPTDPVEEIDQIEENTQAWLGIPLISHEKLIGAFLIQSNQANVFQEEDVRFLNSVARQLAISIENVQLYQELEESFVQTIVALANAMDARDNYTHDHSQRIAVLVNETAKQMGLGAKDLETLRLASLLHDIGKIGVPDDILLKPAKLTDEEYQIIQQHPTVGANIVEPISKLKDVAPIIRHHQEKWNGEGYPDQLKGKQIPLGARVLMVVDSYVAMTDERVYRQPLTPQEALAELQRLAGIQYDPEVVDVFLQVATSVDNRITAEK